jgi:hypothetical protein
LNPEWTKSVGYAFNPYRRNYVRTVSDDIMVVGWSNVEGDVHWGAFNKDMEKPFFTW